MSFHLSIMERPTTAAHSGHSGEYTRDLGTHLLGAQLRKDYRLKFYKDDKKKHLKGSKENG